MAENYMKVTKRHAHVHYLNSNISWLLKDSLKGSPPIFTI